MTEPTQANEQQQTEQQDQTDSQVTQVESPLPAEQELERDIAALKTKQAQQAQKKSGRGLASLSLLVGLLAVGGVAYLYWYGLQWQQSVTLQRNQAQQKLLAQVSQNQSKALQQIKQDVTQITDQAQQQQQIQQQRIEQLLKDFASQQVDSNEQIALRDVRHLVENASRRLWLDNDKVGAQALLNLAAKRIAAMQSAQWINLKKALAQDLGQISALPEHNTSELYFKLAGLIAQISHLPMAEMRLKHEMNEEPTELTTSVDDWQSNLLKALKDFSDYLFKFKTREGVAPMLDQAQANQIRQNLIGKLNQAQWAVLNRQPEVYLAALGRAEQWLQDYFDNNNRSVKSSATAINTLLEASIIDQYPQLKLASLHLVDLMADSANEPAMEMTPQQPVQPETTEL